MTAELRKEGDPLADAAIAELVRTHQTNKVNLVMRELRAGVPMPENLPSCLQEYVTQSRAVPEFLDPGKIGRVQEFFEDDGVQLVAALGIGAMVETYASVAAAKVLHSTQRLQYPETRMQETFRFILYLMERNPFDPDKEFVPAIQKVRLMHASLRQVVRSQRGWNGAEGDIPINQEEMLGATMLFSVGALRILRRINVHITQHEAEGYYHLWRLAGQMLGVRPDLLPETYEDADRLYDLLVAPSWGPSTEGVELTHALIKRYQNGTAPALQGLISAVIRLMVEPRVADWMAVPRTRWTPVLRGGRLAIELLEQAEDRSRVATRVLDRVGQRLFHAQIRKLNDGGKIQFDIPTALHSERTRHRV